MQDLSKFARAAWFTTAYNIAVILWGAWVRISGSGAGCGEHWPTCNGQILPRDPSTATMIEFAHRATSGLTLIFTLGIAIWAARLFAKTSIVRRAANTTLVFVLLEAALGALLVIFGLVDKDESTARALVVGVHLVNTFGLVGAGALCAWWASGHAVPTLSRPHLPGRNLFLMAAVGILLVGMTGAITALGDTLFPVSPTDGQGLLARIRDDITAGEHFLVRLRVLHPAIAIVVGSGLMMLGFRQMERFPGPSKWVVGLVTIELIAGLANIYLAAPGWMQIIHLLLADLLWVSLLILASESLADA
ncbi:MAG: cytochrome c oxidase assembly protein subunit 15 [Myxococcota bacterium]|jgi:cytochrome c oxidase assembly protein subunit 15